MRESGRPVPQAHHSTRTRYKDDRRAQSWGSLSVGKMGRRRKKKNKNNLLVDEKSSSGGEECALPGNDMGLTVRAGGGEGGYSWDGPGTDGVEDGWC